MQRKMKRIQTEELVGVPVDGYETSYFLNFGLEDQCDHVWYSNLLEKAGCRPIHENVADEFEHLRVSDKYFPERFRGYVTEYRKETGKLYPPLCRVKITVEVEELSEDEIEARWEKLALARMEYAEECLELESLELETGSD